MKNSINVDIIIAIQVKDLCMKGYIPVIREHLLNEIEKKRAELLKMVMTNGMTSNITIELSQELDHLLIQYQKELHTGSWGET